MQATYISAQKIYDGILITFFKFICGTHDFKYWLNGVSGRPTLLAPSPTAVRKVPMFDVVVCQNYTCLIYREILDAVARMHKDRSSGLLL